MLILKLVLQVITFGIAVAVISLDYCFHDRRTTRFRLWRRILLALAVAGFAVSLVVLVADDRESRARIAELRQFATGGDSYCIVELHNLKPDGSSILGISDLGRYPLYDVSVQVVDATAYFRLPEEARAYLGAATVVNESVGNLAPDQMRMLRYWQLPPSVEAQDYNVSISMRNGNLFEFIRCRKIAGRWVQAVRLQHVPDGKVLKEYVDSSFPRGPGGEMAW